MDRTRTAQFRTAQTTTTRPGRPHRPDPPDHSASAAYEE
jgi:hypothetical protein